MGREAKRNAEQRGLARKIRDEAHQAFTQSFAILTNALAVTVVITEASGTFDAKGIPEGQTRQFTVCHTAPEIGLAHMSKAAELIHEAHQDTERRFIENREKQKQAEAAGLPTPEGMEEGAADDERWPEDDQGPNVDGVPGKPLPGDDGGES